ncbi:MAG: PAS domain-containing protein [Proteobacteria bacterium]|nr:PAS domain-containing protein [Pseudomonadota bacterium]
MARPGARIAGSSGPGAYADHPVLLFTCALGADDAVHFGNVSGGLTALFGAAPDVAVAGLSSSLEPEDATRLWAALSRSVQDLKPFVIDLRFRPVFGPASGPVAEEARCLETHMTAERGDGGAVSWRAACLDVTEHRRSEQLISLLNDVVAAISEAPEYRVAVGIALQYMCRVAHAVYGEAWLPDTTAAHLALDTAHHDGGADWAGFEAASRALTYTMDIGAIGLCWRTRRALWAEDVRDLVTDHPQRPAPPDSAKGLSAYLQPICVGNETLGIFAFHLDKLGLDGVPDMFETLAAQLGAALQRRRIEQELEYANIIIEESPTVVYRALATEGAPRVYTSRNVTRFGFSVGDCKRGLFNFPGFVHDEDRPAVLAGVQRMLDDGGDVFEHEYRLITASGEIRYVHDRTTAIRDANRHITHWQGALTDITERWRSEQQLAESNRKLEGLSLKLSKYLSPQIYASIFAGKQTAEISTQRKKLTIFFSDIADFTSTTDKLESEELTALLNDYLTEMAAIALRHGATIDKYIGDAILAFFGDPESHGARADALACVRMAIEMQARMVELQREWRHVGAENPFQVRIGINTGFCTVGNFGSADRMDYTVIGGEVNLAARLQSHAELGGILMGHETYSLIKSDIPAEELEPIMVKGFSAPVRIYRVLEAAAGQAAGSGAVHIEKPGARIDIDPDSLSAEDRAEIATAIEGLRERLRRES